MIVVSNTSPLCYLVLIGRAEILHRLYGSVHVTKKVLEELSHSEAPPAVRDWATTPPEWLRIHSDPGRFRSNLNHSRSGRENGFASS
jgi:predicted nucleic acid-binding protein